jgi:hypothetical protein
MHLGNPASHLLMTSNAAQHCIHPTRAARSFIWLVSLAKVRASDRVFPDPRERVMPTLGGSLKSGNCPN